MTCVGIDGDGIGTAADGQRLFVPCTLPGELVRVAGIARRGADWAGVADAILEPGAARADPPCPHFGTCGGCVLQHWRDAEAIGWKASLLAAALRRAGFGDVALDAMVRTPPGARRRMDLAVQRTQAGVMIGLHQARRADAIVDLATCAVLHPALVALLAPLRALLARSQALRRAGSLIVNLLDTGPDLLLRLDGQSSTSDRAALAAFARAHGLARIATAIGGEPPETACLLRPAQILLSGVTVAPPPGAFLQASLEAETAIVEAVLAGLPQPLPPRAWAAELYAGCGTISFALARQGLRVRAWEADTAALAALRQAASGAGLAGRVQVEPRDLARQPVMGADLAGCAVAVLDPPHGGARDQVARIAAALVPRVIYVSCNPATLGRDARLLHQAGYALLRATPIDQFLWSARLECVAVFERPARR